MATKAERVESQIKAMEALFDFYDAMNDGELSTLDLEEVMRQAIGEGYQMLGICLAMAIVALQRAEVEQEEIHHGQEVAETQQT